MPAKAGIQYAAAATIPAQTLWDTGSPPSRGRQPRHGENHVSVFEGLKVIDCASYIAAPAAAIVMSDFGAEVIKIEPLTGDPYRTPAQPPVDAKSPVNPNWLMDSRNKKSLAINLASKAGLEI